VEGRVLGKAANAAQAREYLRLLSESRHEVYSGLHLCTREGGVSTHAVTGVTFRRLTAADIAAYVAAGEWRERAGAYAIQGVGSALVTAVEGDYWNVVGLPVTRLLEGLESFGVAPLAWLDGARPGGR
ncbi:MAG TPA: Maf family protein, partial [Thermoleophilia bacterium]|nr:Maf family protein [Thermoleophilia bacterium]